MSKYIKSIYEGYNYKGMKATKVFPVTERGKVAIGFEIDVDETLDELVTQLCLAKHYAKQNGIKHVSVKAFKTTKVLFVAVEQKNENGQQGE